MLQISVELRGTAASGVFVFETSQIFLNFYDQQFNQCTVITRDVPIPVSKKPPILPKMLVSVSASTGVYAPI